MAAEAPSGNKLGIYILYDGNSSYALCNTSSPKDLTYYSFPSDSFTNYQYDSEIDKYLYIGAEVTPIISDPNYQYLTSSNDDDFLSRGQSSSQSGGYIYE